MLKLIIVIIAIAIFLQPPSGGCVLKLFCSTGRSREDIQPPSGGCVLKRWQGVRAACCTTQPPSGGCVLKPKSQTQSLNYFGPAAFRRLCVETVLALDGKPKLTQPPSGGCVLKLVKVAAKAVVRAQPPSGGCVLKQQRNHSRYGF